MTKVKNLFELFFFFKNKIPVKFLNENFIFETDFTIILFFDIFLIY